MFTLGVPEMAVIFILALVLFGPKKLPELGKTIGKAMTEFRRASNDLKSTFEREMHSLEQENQSIQQVTRDVTKQIRSSVDNLNPLKAEPETPPKAASSTNQNPEGASATSGAPSTNGTDGTPATVEPATESTAQAHVEPEPPPPAKTPALEGRVARGSHTEAPAAAADSSSEAVQNS